MPGHLLVDVLGTALDPNGETLIWLLLETGLETAHGSDVGSHGTEEDETGVSEESGSFELERKPLRARAEELHRTAEVLEILLGVTHTFLPVWVKTSEKRKITIYLLLYHAHYICQSTFAGRRVHQNSPN